MYTREELVDAVNQLSASPNHSIQNCEKLAAVFTVLDHISPQSPPLPQESGYSFESRGGDVIEKYGDSQFLNIIAGKDSREVFKIIDEMVEAISVLNPKLHRAFLSRLSSLDDKIIN